MQPPPQARFNMFNTPNAPRGRFDWSVLSESLELLKINPGTFIAFTLIGGIAAYTISQIINLPQILFMFSPNGLSGSFMGVSIVFGVFANLAMIATLGFVRSGIMIMAKKVMQRQLPDIPEGFQQLNRFFTYAGANLASWAISIPFMLIGALMFSGQMTTMINQSRPDFTTMMPMMIGAGSSYLFGGLVLLFTYPLFALAVPAAFVENLNFTDSLKRAFELGKANYGNLLLFSVVAGIINQAALSCCCLPALFVYPWIATAYLLIYRDVANIPIVTGLENASQTPYPREYGMTMPNFDPTQAETPRPDAPERPITPPPPSERGP
ncbi:MAG: hypothetical protein ACKVQS_10930 [Fimbriimonadaceae bacterium]